MKTGKMGVWDDEKKGAGNGGKGARLTIYLTKQVEQDLASN